MTLSVVAVTMAGRSFAIDDQAGLVIRSTTRLVQMSVVAQDKQGRPVVDLKSEDFEVFDNGKRCPTNRCKRVDRHSERRIRHRYPEGVRLANRRACLVQPQ